MEQDKVSYKLFNCIILCSVLYIIDSDCAARTGRTPICKSDSLPRVPRPRTCIARHLGIACTLQPLREFFEMPLAQCSSPLPGIITPCRQFNILASNRILKFLNFNLLHNYRTTCIIIQAYSKCPSITPC